MRLGPLEITWGRKQQERQVSPLFAAFMGMFQQDVSEIKDTKQGHGDAYRAELWVYRCVAIKATVAAMAKPVLYRPVEDGRERVPRSDLLDLLRDMNPYTHNYASMMVATCSALDLWGNAFWFLDGERRPEAIYWLNPKDVTPVPDPRVVIREYELLLDGEIVRVPAERIIHFRYFNPHSQIWGLTPISAARLSINLSLAAKQYNRAFFKNMIRLGGVFTTDSPLTEEQRQFLVAQVRSALAGAENAFRWMLGEAGLKPQALTLPPKDAEFVEQNRLSREEISAIFGVPPTVAGASSAANYATAREEFRWFVELTIKPLLSFVAEELTWSLVPFFGEGLELEFDATPYDAMLEDAGEKHEMVRDDLRAGLLTINEARQILYPHLPRLEAGDVLMIPVNILPQPVQALGYRAPAVIESRPNGHLVVGEGRAPALPGDRYEFGSPQHEAVWRSFARRAEGYERGFAARLRREFRRQEEEALSRLADLLGPEPEEARQVVTRQGDEGIAGSIFDLDGENERLSAVIGPVLTDIVENEGRIAAADLGAEFDPFHQRVQVFLHERQRALARVVNETTFNQLKETLAEGIAAGEGVDELAQRVQGVFAHATTTRAERIARTETIGASNFAHTESYRQSGVVQWKRWLSALDERVRDSHRAAHGQTVPLESPFEVGGSALMHPGDPSGPVWEIVNCRCTVAPVIEEERS